jgi:hypothetical protein
MANRRHPNRLAVVDDLIEDSIGANSQRVQAAQPALERIALVWFALEQAKRILDRVDQGPPELKQLPARAAGEDKPRQESAGGWSALGQLAAKLGQGHRLATLDLR